MSVRTFGIDVGINTADRMGLHRNVGRGYPKLIVGINARSRWVAVRHYIRNWICVFDVFPAFNPHEESSFITQSENFTHLISRPRKLTEIFL